MEHWERLAEAQRISQEVHFEFQLALTQAGPEAVRMVRARLLRSGSYEGAGMARSARRRAPRGASANRAGPGGSAR